MPTPTDAHDDRHFLDLAINRSVQTNSAIRHGETDCIENAGRLPASVYRECVLYTTLSPCTMCAGTVILYEIPRIVVGENRTFEASEAWLRSHGTAVDVVDDTACLALMERMLHERPALWAETSGNTSYAVVAGYSTGNPSPRAMSMRWTSDVPSPISRILASR